jgi:hypothetical protein
MRGKKKPLDLGGAAWVNGGGTKVIETRFFVFQQQFLSRVGNLPVGKDIFIDFASQI